MLLVVFVFVGVDVIFSFLAGICLLVYVCWYMFAGICFWYMLVGTKIIMNRDIVKADVVTGIFRMFLCRYF